MIQNTQFERELNKDTPVLTPAWVAYTTDEKSVYVIDERENIKLLNQNDKFELSSQMAEISSVIFPIESEKRLTIELNDTGRFQRALAKLETQEGGNVFLAAKEYVANIKIPSNCGIVGVGRKSIIKIPDNSITAAIELKDGKVRNTYLHNFSIDGNKANQTSLNARGISYIGSSFLSHPTPVETNDARHFIQDIFIVNTKGTGFHLEGRGECNVINVNVMLADNYGFYLNSFDNTFDRLSSGANGKTGIYIGTGSFNCRFSMCKSWNNAVYQGKDINDGFGFWIEQCEGVILMGCEAQANYHHGFYFNLCRDITGIGLNSELNGDGGVNSCGYALNESKNCIIIGGVRNGTSNYQDYALGLYNYSDNNTITISCYQMSTGAVYNPQKRITNNIQINGDRRYMESVYDYLSVGTVFNKQLAKFQAEGKRGENVLSALISKNFNGDLSEDEILRVQAWDGMSLYHNALQVKYNMINESTRLCPRKRLYIDKEVQIGDGLWNGQRLLLGNYNLWVDSTGKLRMKDGAPISDTDGTIVGS